MRPLRNPRGQRKREGPGTDHENGVLEPPEWRLKQVPGIGRLRLAVTGYGQESDRRRTAAAGFDDHLVKPVNVDALIALVDD